MDLAVPGPLAELDESQLYRLLGDAWYAQIELDFSQGLYFAPPEEIGRREYEALFSNLQADLRRPRRSSVVPCVLSTIQRSAAWRMPATLVAALAIKHGLAQSESLASRGRELDLDPLVARGAAS